MKHSPRSSDANPKPSILESDVSAPWSNLFPKKKPGQCNWKAKPFVAARVIAPVIALALTGCVLHESPDCEVNEGISESEAFLTVLAVAEIEIPAWQRRPGDPKSLRKSNLIRIDQQGRSEFFSSALTHGFSSNLMCGALTRQDLQALQQAWAPVPHDSGGAPEPPYLLVERRALAARVESAEESAGAGAEASYVTLQRLTESADLEHATFTTIDILQRIYGKRFIRQLRAADLEFLLQEAD